MCSAKYFKQGFCSFWSYRTKLALADHDSRSVAAIAQAATGKQSDGAVICGFPDFNPQQSLEVFHQRLASNGPAGDGITDMDDVPPHRTTVDHFVKGGQFLDLQS